MHGGVPIEDVWNTKDYSGSTKITVSGTKREFDYKWSISTTVQGCLYSVTKILRKTKNFPSPPAGSTGTGPNDVSGIEKIICSNTSGCTSSST